MGEGGANRKEGTAHRGVLCAASGYLEVLEQGAQ